MNSILILLILFYFCSSFKIADVINISSGGYFTTVTTKNNEIWLWGMGSDGSGTKILQEENLNEVVCGGYHCIGLAKESGKVFYWDVLSQEKKGLQDGIRTIKPTLIEIPEKISRIATGFNHSIAITEQGRVYSWGESLNGKLGQKAKQDDFILPDLVNIPHDVKIKDSCCGGEFTLLLDSENRVWSFGTNTNGQLGRRSEEDFDNIPRLIQFHESVHKITCGGDHSILLTYDGKAFSFGWGELGQLGHGTLTDEHFPKLIDNIESPIIDASVSGYGHSILLTDTNDVLTFGWNEYKQLGFDHEKDVSVPTLIPELEGVTYIKNNNGFKHTFFMLENSENSSKRLILIGDNSYGQIQIGKLVGPTNEKDIL